MRPDHPASTRKYPKRELPHPDMFPNHTLHPDGRVENRHGRFLKEPRGGFRLRTNDGSYRPVSANQIRQYFGTAMTAGEQEAWYAADTAFPRIRMPGPLSRYVCDSAGNMFLTHFRHRPLLAARKAQERTLADGEKVYVLHSDKGTRTRMTREQCLQLSGWTDGGERI